jgi:hypothetical protein
MTHEEIQAVLAKMKKMAEDIIREDKELPDMPAKC